MLGDNDIVLRAPKVFDPLTFIQDIGWGFIFLLAALMKILGILLEKKWLRKLGLTFSMFLYGLISAGYILSGETLHTGTGTYFALSVLALWGIREVKGHAN